MASQKSKPSYTEHFRLMFSRRWCVGDALGLHCLGSLYSISIWQLDRLTGDEPSMTMIDAVQSMPPLNLPAQVDLTDDGISCQSLPLEPMIFKIKSRPVINTMAFSPGMICLRRFNFPTGRRFSLTEAGFPLAVIPHPLIGAI